MVSLLEYSDHLNTWLSQIDFPSFPVGRAALVHAAWSWIKSAQVEFSIHKQCSLVKTWPAYEVTCATSEFPEFQFLSIVI